MSDEEEKKETEPADAPSSGEAKENDSEVLEFEFNEDGEEDLKKTLKKFRADLKVCRTESREYLTGWQKERAEFLNYKKQEEARKINFSEAMRERILTRFLTVLDSFNMAFANKETWDKVDENWRKGVEYIYAQMNIIFEEYGVKVIGEMGETFDPNIHQSIEMVETNEKENDHKIAEIVQKGYLLGNDPHQGGTGRVMRPARVKVYEYRERN